MEKSFQPQEIRPVDAPAPRAPAVSEAPPAGNICQRCQLPSDETHQVTSADGVVGPRLCTTCVRRSEEDAKRVEAARKQPRVDAELERLREMRAAEASRPSDPHFCTHDETHRDTHYQAGRPAVGLNERGELCCSECLPPELNPAKLAERLALVEQALAAQGQASKSKKAVAQ